MSESVTLSEPPTLSELAGLECEIWGVPRNGQRTLFDTALHGVIEVYKQGIERESFVGECVAAHSGRPDESQRYAAAVTAFLAGKGIETLPTLRDNHSALHTRSFQEMEECRERRDERLFRRRAGF